MLKVKAIQWRLQKEFEDLVIRIGGFRFSVNYLRVLGKECQLSGIEDMLIESGMYGSSTTSILLRTHKLVMEAMFCLPSMRSSCL